MSSQSSATGVHLIGETAGVVWRALRENGPLSLAKIVDQAGRNRDLVMQAVGWLAREGKISIADTKRGKIVSLVELS